MRVVRWIVLAFLVLLLMSASLLAASLPQKETPIYPGAVRDQAAEREYLEDAYLPENLVFHEIRAYKVDTIIDDVARYYLELLKPKPGWPEEDPYSLGPGASLGPWYEPEFYRPEIFEDQYEYNTLIQDGKWIRTAFEARPQWQKGKWLAQMVFQWAVMSAEGELTTYGVLVEDAGYDWKKRVDFKASKIWVETMVVQTDDLWSDDWDGDWDDDWDDDWDSDWEMEQEVALDPPTEGMLGIPFYPGWAFSPHLSASMSQDDYHYYVFFSDDSPDQVAAFYKRHLGKEPAITDGDYLFALKGKLPVPDDGLAIQPNNVFFGQPQTIITVQKQMRD